MNWRSPSSCACSDSVVSEAVDLGASYFLTKPVEENALLDRMRTRGFSAEAVEGFAGENLRKYLQKL